MALNQIPHTHSDPDNDALLSRVSKAADGTDTAYKDMVLCQVESVLMGDPLATARAYTLEEMRAGRAFK